MNGLIRFSLSNPRAITVLVLTIVLGGAAALMVIPADILPIYRSPAVQVLTFYGGMSATNVEADITARMERQTGQAAGTIKQDSRSIVGASIVRNYYADGTDPSGALTQVNSLATAAIPNLPPGTLPPVILPFDPTSVTPVGIVALNSRTQSEAVLYDAARYEIRNFIMASPGANAPVVYGGKLRTILAMLDREKLQARGLSPIDVMDALDRQNVFLPAGDAKFGGTDYASIRTRCMKSSNGWGTFPCVRIHAAWSFCGMSRRRKIPHSSRRTSSAWMADGRSIFLSIASRDPARCRLLRICRTTCPTCRTE